MKLECECHSNGIQVLLSVEMNLTKWKFPMTPAKVSRPWIRGRGSKVGTREFLSNPGVILGCVSPCGNELLVKSPRVLRPCIFDNPFCELNLDLGRNLCNAYS